MSHKFTLNFTLVISILLGLSLVLLANCAFAATGKSQEELQIGEEWSRTPYKDTLTTDVALNNAIKATAKIIVPIDNYNRDKSRNNGTAIYLGKFNGKHLMITNLHVMPESKQCLRGTKVYIQFLNKRRTFKCSEVVANFPDIETVFFTIHVTENDEPLFKNLALKFDFKNSYRPGDKLITAGYGQFKNTQNTLTYDNSTTCLVASDTSAPQLINMTDAITKKTYHVWSFIHSCEISHGDSGSAVVSETTGKAIGLNWSATIEKPEALKNSAVVFDWIQNQNPLIWFHMSLGVSNKSILLDIQQKNDETLNEFVESNLQQSLVSN